MIAYDYGNWIVVAISVAFFLFFVLSYITPIRKREWHSAGVYTAFIIALFTEMYGFPLTIYILSSAFGISVGFSNAEGHLIASLLAKLGVLELSTGVAVVMIVSSLLILVGLSLIIVGWRKIHRSKETLVMSGIYAHVRHPQYLGIILITGAFLIQWPTMITLAMWPILVVMYYRLAKREERLMETKFGTEYLGYKERTPMFIPSIGRLRTVAEKGG